MKSKLKESKGITLAALVITIILLIILAAVTFTFVLGEDGLIARTTRASQEQVVAKEREQIQLAYSELQLKKSIGEISDILATDFKTSLENNGNAIRSLELVDDEFVIVFDNTGNEYKINKITGIMEYSKNNGSGSGNSGESGQTNPSSDIENFVPGVDATTIEDFEDDNYNITIATDSETGWLRTDATGDVIDGNYSYRSRQIGDGASTSATITINIPDNGLEYFCKFDYIVSSEGYDHLNVKKGNELILDKSGEQNGCLENIPLYTGENVIELIYYKDGSSSNGKDAAIIDNFEIYIRELTAPIIQYENTENYNVKVSILYPTISNKDIIVMMEQTGKNMIEN